MTQYIYEKYNSQSVYASEAESLQGTYSTSSYQSYPNHYLNENTGQYNVSGALKTIYPTSGTFSSDSVYETVSGGTTLFRSYFQGSTLYTYQRSSYLSRYVRGSYIGTVKAEEDEYPADGRHTDGYWYTRTIIADAPTLTTPNGGEAISSEYLIAWTAPTTGLQFQIDLSTDGGSSWETIVSETEIDADTYSYNFSNESESSVAKIRIRGKNGSSYTDYDMSDGVFTIQHNLPPNKPTNLSPSGTAVDRTIVQRLSWKHNDPNINDTQSRADIQWRKQGNSTWNTATVRSNKEYYDFSSNVFPEGQIEWRVKTSDQVGIESPYSDIRVFTAAEATDAPTISSPGTTISVSRPNIQWSSTEQTAYQIVIDNTLGDTLWNTGTISTTWIRARTIGIDLVNGGQYVIKLRTKNNAGLWSEYAILNATVSYTPPPNPIINVDSATGHLVISNNNPTPNDTQPEVTRNDLYKHIDGEWVLISEDVSFIYRDYAVANGETYKYKIRAIGENGTFSDSEISEGSTTFRGVWLHDITSPEATVYNFRFDGGGRSSQWEVESAVMRFKGRRSPVVETGEMQDDIVSFSLTLLDTAQREALERLVYSRNILCYRDGRGRLVFGVITRLPLADEIWGGQTTSLEIMRIDYKEGV
ncbi:hypothetical protein FZC79_10495 [Rossellomorea vietnamensis]|uniref:Fibronectin type-III domain-containing protein n=1 Tax=Rossellomorea vietnamensis TaxID=218284 RepID=A0A5D4KE05_9BACI|nr:hypothetical protein [Rossellomorea vietnamensis]TYR75587.1 hypothetical protein FZC79_10495 [Rossellomorea vietnamensis]